MKPRTAALAAVLAVLLLAVCAVASGCGSASSDDGVAALDEAATTTSEDESSQPAANDEEDPQEAALAWAKCMREEGVDVPDPEVTEGGGGPRLTIRPGAGGRRLDDVDSNAFRKAMEKCGRPLGGAGAPRLSEEEREELQEQMLEFAKCMRDHGVDMPDPDFSGGGGRMLFRAGPGGVNPDDETFREAQEACQDILEGAMRARGDAGARSDAE